MTRTRVGVVIAAALILGIIAGGSIDEAYHRSGDATDRRLFTAKVRCQKLSEKYSTDNSTSAIVPGSSMVTTTILRVDYSPAAHSCIAETERSQLGFAAYSIIDIVTGDMYGGGVCKEGDYCKRRSSDISKTDDETFNRAVTGTIKPLDR